jgi:hygromycin-B 7''-O-kinase
VYVVDGRYRGIIDWGDMTVTDRHLELIQVYRDLFHCDKALFLVFLEAAEWPVGREPLRIFWTPC